MTDDSRSNPPDMQTLSSVTPSQGPSGDLEQVFQDHYRLIVATAYRVTGRSEDAEDVLQTVHGGPLLYYIPPVVDLSSMLLARDEPEYRVAAADLLTALAAQMLTPAYAQDMAARQLLFDSLVSLPKRRRTLWVNSNSNKTPRRMPPVTLRRRMQTRSSISCER